jgi:TetR/AcrR family transcriptional regulator, transcriptional repressor for nem operon
MSFAQAPPTARGRATRERIVEVAGELMIRRGVASTSLDEVRAAASVSKSQLYHYFADKDDLVRAVVASTIDGVLGAQPQLADLSSMRAISAWFDLLVAVQVERHAVGGCPIGGLVSELADHDEQTRDLLAGGFDRWEAPLRLGLETMRADGRLRSEADPERLATATLASVEGGLMLTQARRDPEQLRTALDASLAHLRSFEA